MFGFLSVGVSLSGVRGRRVAGIWARQNFNAKNARAHLRRGSTAAPSPAGVSLAAPSRRARRTRPVAACRSARTPAAGFGGRSLLGLLLPPPARARFARGLLLTPGRARRAAPP